MMTVSGSDNLRVLASSPNTTSDTARTERRRIVGGLISEYHRTY
jgi:hypothetical protein